VIRLSIGQGNRLATRWSWLRFPPRLILGWMTVYGRANHLNSSPIHPVQLSSSAGR